MQERDASSYPVVIFSLTDPKNRKWSLHKFFLVLMSIGDSSLIIVLKKQFRCSKCLEKKT